MEKLAILIAEDDADDRYLLKIAFDENKFSDNLQFVEDGYELMKCLFHLKQKGISVDLPDFILLDINMPKKNGREVLLELKEDSVLSNIPVIVFSTTGNESEKKRCIDLGAKSYYTKPVSFEALVNMVASIRNSQSKLPLKNTNFN